MARVPNRASTRIWLDAALKERKLDALSEMVELYWRSDDDIKLRVLENIWDRLFPKARPEDGDGNADNAVMDAQSRETVKEDILRLIALKREREADE
jgi:hypothetical protein